MLNPLTRIAFPLLALALVYAGCASHSPRVTRSEGARSLRWVKSADPERDAIKAFARRDYRFLGVYGFAPYTPAIAPEIAARYGVKYIEGTSDAAGGAEGVDLNHRAKIYAAQYNTTLLQRLSR